MDKMKINCKGASCPQEHHSIGILNWKTEEEVCYSIVVVEGIIKADCDCSSERWVIVERLGGSCHIPPFTNHYIADNFKFKCVIKLELGKNSFIIRYCSVQQEFIFYFKPRLTEFCILPVYVICKGHDGRFQAPEHEDNSIESACDRIATGMRLLQSLIAELLNKFGFGRRTFQLQSDIDPMAPECQVFYSKYKVEEVYSTDSKTLWAWLARELMTSRLGNVNHKFVAFLSCTYYKGKMFSKMYPTKGDIEKCTKGHVALGAGGLALVHTGCLYTWAASVEEVVPRLSCTSQVDSVHFMDESNYRGTYGGCYSTGLGMVAHELGHTFDLGHTTHGVMGPEYHNIHYMFLPEEAKVFDQVLQPKECCKEDTIPSPRYQEQNMTVGSNRTKEKQAQKCTAETVEKVHEATVMLEPQLRVSWSSSDQHMKDSDANQVNQMRPVEGSQREQTQEEIFSPESEENYEIDPDIYALDYLQPTLDEQDVSTFFTQSCLGFLAFNKWINPNGTIDTTNMQDCIVYDRHRNCITSVCGMRVMEMRDSASKIYRYWLFLGNGGVKVLAVFDRHLTPETSHIYIIDSSGHTKKLELNNPVDPLPPESAIDLRIQT